MNLLLAAVVVVAVSLPTVQSDLSCPGDFHYSNDARRCYKAFTGEKVSALSARMGCAKEGAFLVSVHSKEENQFIKDLFGTKPPEIIFLGMQSAPHNVTVRYWVDGTVINIEFWMPEKPDNGEFESDNCLVMHTEQGVWDDWPCKGEADKPVGGYVCVKAPICPEGFEYSWMTNHCYKVLTIGGGTTYQNGKELCSNLNAELASIHNEEENQFIKFLAMKPYTGTRVFIGLSSSAENIAQRSWSDGTELDYSNWQQDSPHNDDNEMCVVFVAERGGVWDDWPCANSCNKCKKNSVFGVVCKI